MTQEVSPVSGTTAHRYNDHAELVESTDARSVTVKRQLDALDRVTLIDYPTAALDTSFSYDSAPAACSGSTTYPVGRLASIGRDGVAVDYCYDRFGRPTRDGELTYTYDANGNVATIGYPGSILATYTYDLVGDRQTGLSVTTLSGTEAVASSATYAPSGPLTGLSLGNGTTETRGFDERYFPASIAWTGSTLDHAWTYTTDALGNITSITDTATCGGNVTVDEQTISTSETLESCADLQLGPNLTLDSTADVTVRATGAVRIQSGFSVAVGGTMSVETGATVLPPPEVRTYDYRDGPYFLTRGDGPWGERDWSYDRIGNRVSETRDRSGTPVTDTYSYTPNGSSGNTALLDEITLSPTGSADYGWDAAGNLNTLVRGANHLDFTFDEASRMSLVERGDGMTVADSSSFVYDGRGYLRQATEPASGATVAPLYDSAGLLQALVEKDSPASPERHHTLFYLAGRPVAQLTQQDGTETWQYLTTDHLGTPLLAADDTGAITWRGGFEPFGHDYAEGLSDAALAADVFLRFPGQWEIDLWANAALGSGGIYYNVHRWYEPSLGQYVRTDPLGTLAGVDLFAYARSRPTVFVDLLGLKAKPSTGVWCEDLPPEIPTCTCDKKLLGSELEEVQALRSDFCQRKGISHSTRTEDPVKSRKYKEGGSVDGDRSWYDPIVTGDDPCIIACVCDHEENHRRMLHDPRIEQMVMDKSQPRAPILDYLECTAYTSQASCLKELIDAR